MSVFSWPTRVYYEDTDATGVAYHASYLRYFERARTEWLRAMGQGQESLRQLRGLAFTVANLEIDFLRPARLDDELTASVQVEAIKGASLQLSQVMTRRSDAAELARARVRVACVDEASFKPRRLPADVFERANGKEQT